MHNSVPNSPDNIAVGYRRQVEIDHLDRAGRCIRRYVLKNCIPIEFSPASDFKSDADDGLSIERLVIAYEGFEVITTEDSSGNPFNPKDILKKSVRRLF